MKDEFQQVVTRYADVLYRLAFSYCGNPPDAEDVVQDVFVKYLRCRKTFESEDKRRAWLMTVTANRCLDLLRSHERRKTQSIETMPETAAPDQEDYSDIHEAIQALSPKYRGIVFLYYFENRTTPEIAQLLGLSKATVRTRLLRARNLLKEHLGGA